LPAPLLLDIDERAGRQQSAFIEESTQFLVATVSERRVEEYDVVGSRGVPLLQEIVPVHLMHSDARCGQEANILAQPRRRCRRILDQVDGFRAPRQRLEPERAGTGKEVQATSALDDRRNPVEQRFPYPCRRRPQSLDIRDRQKAASPLSRYNTQPPWRRSPGSAFLWWQALAYFGDVGPVPEVTP